MNGFGAFLELMTGLLLAVYLIGFFAFLIAQAIGYRGMRATEKQYVTRMKEINQRAKENDQP